MVEIKLKILWFQICYMFTYVYIFNKRKHWPGQVAQLGRVSSQHTKVANLIPGQGTYKKQQMNA